MDAGISTARELRAEHRHELRSLTYLTVDHATGGVIRNLNQTGLAAQMLTALQPGQQVRLRFEVRIPKVRVEALAEVVWTSRSGQCGMRFLNLPRSMRQQINEWILNDLLQSASLHAERSRSISRQLFEIATPDKSESEELTPACEEEDGLLISGSPAKVITLPLRRAVEPLLSAQDSLHPLSDEIINLDWLSQPLSPRALARIIDSLTVLAAFLLFILIFLSVIRDAPAAPFTTAGAGLVSVAIVYWGFFWIFGGESLGSRLARTAGLQRDGQERGTIESKQ